MTKYISDYFIFFKFNPDLIRIRLDPWMPVESFVFVQNISHLIRAENFGTSKRDLNARAEFKNGYSLDPIWLKCIYKVILFPGVNKSFNAKPWQKFIKKKEIYF